MLRFLSVFLFSLFLPVVLVAQETADADVTNPMTSLMQEAAKHGMTVIIMDANGNAVPTEVTPQESVVEEVVEGDSGNTIMMVQSEVDQFRDLLQRRLDAWPASVNEVLFILRASSPTGEIFTFVEVLLWSLLLFFVALFPERYIYGKRIAARFVMPMIKENPVGYSDKLPFLVVRFIGGVLGVIFSMAVAFILGWLLFGSSDDTAIDFTIGSIYFAYFVARVAALLWRMILSPFLDQYRIPAFSTRDAKRLYRWLFLLASLDICTQVFGDWLRQLGLNYDVYALLTLALVSIFSLGNILMALVNYKPIANAIRNGKALEDVSLPLRLVSVFWAPVFIVYVVYGFFDQAFDLILEVEESVPALAAAYGIFMAIIVVYATINFCIEKFFDRARRVREMNEELQQEEEQAEETESPTQEQLDEIEELKQRLEGKQISTYEQLARRVSGILAVVAGVYAAVLAFGAGEMMTESVSNRALDVLVIVFIGYIVFHVFRIWVDGKIREEQGEEEEGELGDEGGANSASRLATLLPLFRAAMLLVIVISIILIVLLELGVNVSPLFAGAGVVGLAVGFGAQSLVRDIFSGAFFLFDDAFRKGEYIDIGSVKGTVEKISVRSFQLRHHLGPLHTIPFGEIQYLTNYSRDWVIMKLKLRVTYDTDVERVRKLIKNLGIELLDDPTIGHNFIQPLKSQGVVEMQDSAMIIRVKFMTKPGDQWLVRKKVYQDIRELFEREGIKFAHREVTVRIADDQEDRELTPKQKEAVVGAVEAAIDEDAMEGGPDDDR
ncbi:mechanosensitive ion channel family protein [Shimia haliotis]|uniref:Small-conductance mechanosensitive channel n=1 Tax=Shimia haliotis TaxID=1280847 RepID=A0A1I4EAI7_9RHOB|nr:mechanosensitive ion channel family protein [Shimia haliotis]SFL02283.1 Small-conductance mechanosensitive channel [Shimia haliotis]